MLGDVFVNMMRVLHMLVRVIVSIGEGGCGFNVLF